MVVDIGWEKLDRTELEQIINLGKFYLDALDREERLMGVLAEITGGIDVVEGRPWVQPTGSHNVYPLGVTVTHEGHLWRSEHPFNAWPPGTPNLWTDLGKAPASVDAPPADDHPAWEPGIQVRVGDIVAHDRTLYRVVQAHTTQAGWEPPMAPALFTRI